MTNDDDNIIVSKVREQVDIIPYRKRERVWNYFIYVIILLNVVIIISFLPWSELW